MNPEALDALQRVVALSPENILAQKLLSQIYMDLGDYDLSKNSLEALLALNPADTESRLLLESLERTAASNRQDVSDPLESGGTGAVSFMVELDASEENAEELETLDLVEELDELEGSPSFFAEQEPFQPALIPDHDAQTSLDDPVDYPVGIRTATIAELYVTQGHLEQALDIYQELFAASPENLAHRKRIEELERLLAESKSSSMLEPPDEAFSVVEPEAAGFADVFSVAVTSDETPSPNTEGTDELVVLLQGWLDNIRRARECRSGRD
jgi:tetratricopeptide (TPR) repeat protein